MTSRRLPAAVYWRRRLLVLAALIALVWVGTRLWPADGDARASAETQGPPARTPSSPSDSPASSAAEPEPSPAADDSTTVSLTGGGDGCDPETVRVVPSVPAGQRAGGPVLVDLVLSSTADAPCTVSAEPAELLAVVSSDGTAIWDSRLCSARLFDGAVSLSPEWATQVRAAWPGTGSGPTCAGTQAFVSAGRYTVEVGTPGGEPGRVSFTLDAVPEPEPTPKPESKPTAEAESSPVRPSENTEPAAQD